MGIGAYTVGLCMVHLKLSFWAALGMAALVSLLFAWVVGMLGLRLTRYYLAITTISFTLLMRFFYVNGGAVTFGPSGFNIPSPKIFGFAVNTDHRLYFPAPFRRLPAHGPDGQPSQVQGRPGVHCGAGCRGRRRRGFHRREPVQAARLCRERSPGGRGGRALRRRHRENQPL